MQESDPQGHFGNKPLYFTLVRADKRLRGPETGKRKKNEVSDNKLDSIEGRQF